MDMKTKSWLLSGTLLLAACGTANISTENKTQEQTSAPTEQAVKYHVEAIPEVMSIAEGIDLYNDHGNMEMLARKYGYKTVKDYAIYRLDKYEAMLYKNCRLPKKMGNSGYEDTPLPQAKGVSSYVSVGNTIQMAVFNNKAYENLVEQIKGLGFSLQEEGYEDRYSNGTIDIYIYKEKRLFRIEKTL